METVLAPHNYGRVMEYIFTFSWGQLHPVTGEKLEDKFVRVYGMNYKDARRNMMDMFGSRWAEQYESEWQAGVDDLGLKEIEVLERKDWKRGMEMGLEW